MSSKALLLLFVFFTAMAVIQAGSVNVKACDSACTEGIQEGNLADARATKCCQEHDYQRGHCAIFWLTQKAWCDDHK